MTDKTQEPEPEAIEILGIGHPIPPMPKEIAAAICEVMTAMKSLEKDAKNPHAGYQYAGVESFLELLRPACAKAGLVIDTDEEDVSFRTGTTAAGKATNWLLIKFSFTLSHKSGQTWGHRSTRTAMVNANMGSQAFGAAQSYAFKQYARMLFMISTGEESPDVDQNAPEPLSQDQSYQPEPAVNQRAAPETQVPQENPAPETQAPKSDLPIGYSIDPAAFMAGTHLELPIQETKDGKKYWKRWQARMIELVKAAPDLNTLRALEGDNMQGLVKLGAASPDYFASVSDAFAHERKVFSDMDEQESRETDTDAAGSGQPA